LGDGESDFPAIKKISYLKNNKSSMIKWRILITGKALFPYTLLLDAEGKFLRAWDGYPKENVIAFIEEIKQAVKCIQSFIKQNFRL
jgi:type IV secretory pathway protease TraF